MSWMIFAVLIVLGFLIHKWLKQNYSYFKERNIAFGKPKILFGTGKDLILQRLSLPEYIQHWYNEFPDEKIVGLFDFRKPFFFIRDPDLAKTICIKEFDHFPDHIHSIDESIDPLLGSALLMLSGKKWRDMRATLSPAFTGSKMRLMLNLVIDTTQTSVQSVKKLIEGDVDQGTLEMKFFFAKFMVDTIASCAFGIEVSSFKNPDNDFQKIAEKTMKPNGALVAFKYAFLCFVPNFMKKLDISILDRHTKNFFRRTVNETMKYREKNNILRPDMIQLLFQTKKGQLHHDATDIDEAEGLSTVHESGVGKRTVTTEWTSDELVAQCLIFFLAGFDTTSTTLAFAAYELAVNPEIQERLRNVVRETNKQLSGDRLSYEALHKMKYLDQFVTEVLRKWTPAPGIERICVKDFTFNLGGNDITIPKDHSVMIPAYGWHRDPKYFPNPNTFDPDRFNDDNISLQNMKAFAPFGIGPRNCIGSRFALMMVKTVLYEMLLNFSFDVAAKTEIPFKYKKSMMTIEAENGNWVHLKALKR